MLFHIFVDEPKVFLHVNDDIEHFTTMESLLKTVASIVDCTLDDIKIVRLQPDQSFIIIITMRAELISILKETDPHYLRKLLQFNVDWIRIEDNVVNIVTGKYFCRLLLFTRLVNISLFKKNIINTLSKSILSLSLPSIKLLRNLKIIFSLPSYKCIHQKANLRSTQDYILEEQKS